MARIISSYYSTDVVFIERNNNKTPDFSFRGKQWELKSPRGNGERTIDNILRDATKQSENVVINLHLSKMRRTVALSRIEHYFKNGRSGIKNLLIITKEGQIIDFTGKMH